MSPARIRFTLQDEPGQRRLPAGERVYSAVHVYVCHPSMSELLHPELQSRLPDSTENHEPQS